MLILLIDLDDCITYQPEFFSLFTNSMKGVALIHIITNRERTPESEQNTKEQLQNLGIHYDHLIITSEKMKYILENGVSIYYDDTDEYFLDLPETVTVFKIRESWNFDFEKHKWVYSNKTGRNIDKG
jgi:hypothetical protein